MTSVIVDYNSGNLHSTRKSFQLISTELNMGEVKLSSDPEEILKAERIILPGVGSFDDCKSNLIAVNGLIDALELRVEKDGIPFLGICVGHQLMASIGLENNKKTEGLGWISGSVKKISPSGQNFKIPHIGWNTLKFDKKHRLFDGINEQDHTYFVHSYHFVLDDQSHRLCHTNYGEEITAAVVKDNMVGTQFHPEKSQAVGLTFIRNFLLWRP